MSNQLSKAKKFVERWSSRGNEREDTQLFWIELCQDVLDMSDALKRLHFEYPVRTGSVTGHEGYIDVFIPSSSVLIEQKSKGVDLDKAEIRQKKNVTPVQQALNYASALPLSEQPRYIITCNFDTFRIYDRDRNPLCTSYLYELKLEDLPDHLSDLSFIVGASDAPIILSEAVSIRAGEIMGTIHDRVAEQFINPDDEQSHHALSVFCTRIMFLMFCEDAGLIGPNVFRDYVEHYQADDLRKAFLELFAWLDTPEDERDPYANKLLKAFPYMNGGLFREATEIPTITEDVRYFILVEGCQEFNWSTVDPTVFGSIFEGALSHEQRHSGGMHYTSLRNIHKLIDALFLDDLNEELNAILDKPAGSGKTRMLNNFHKKLGSLVFLDPAAGSGNFLTETYKCLRQLENKILFEQAKDNQTYIEFTEATDQNSVLVSLDNFHGIEINDFACCVARTALWIAEKQADIETEKVTTRAYDALPLKDYSCVIKGNALRMDWNDVVSAFEVDYIIGNPPFLGSSTRTSEQTTDMEHAFTGNKWGKVDYCGAWYHKAASYIDKNTRCAFVSTNSICQGEQVLPMWKDLFAHGIYINFAYRTFEWDAQSSDVAHVHVVIIGFSKAKDKFCNLYFSNGEISKVDYINAYLYPASDVFLKTRSISVNEDSPTMTQGSKPVDGGNLIMSYEEKELLTKKYPELSTVIQPLIGSREFLHGNPRYCFWFEGKKISDYSHIPEVADRLKRVEECRLKSPTKEFRDSAKTPWLFTQNRQPKRSFIVCPVVSSGRRKYAPFGYLDSSTIITDALQYIASDSLYIFGLVSSLMHNAWLRVVAGRLKSDYRYRPLVYNSFVFPNATDEQKAHIEQCAQNILDARKLYNDKSLSDLYDPDKAMFFPELFAAHKALDKAVEGAYGVEFDGDEEKIVAHLFKLYAEKTK